MTAVALLIASLASVGAFGESASGLPGAYADLLKTGKLQPTVLTEKVRTLEDGRLYYLTNDLVFAASNPGTSGLSVGPGATVYLCIPAGRTLTCKGSAGTSAESGKGGEVSTAKAVSKYNSEGGITCQGMTFSRPSGGAGGSGGTGGGAGIHVPVNATLAVYGEGTLVAVGGAGGAGGMGGAAADKGGRYYQVSWTAPQKGTPAKDVYKRYQTNTGIQDGEWSGATTDYDAHTFVDGQPSGGGGGGGGAGGGGAAIGTPGAPGTAGSSGAGSSGDWDWKNGDKLNVVVVSNAVPAAKALIAASAGKVYLSDAIVKNMALTNGAGGVRAAGEPKKIESITYSCEYFNTSYGGTAVNKMFFTEGQPGGNGGSGGNGASIGRGGAGGTGGTGGDSGSFGTSLCNEIETYVGESKVGDGGANGGDPAKDDEHLMLQGTDCPYSLAVFGAVPGTLSDFTNRYYVLQASEVSAPTYTGHGLLGWRVSVPALQLPGTGGGSAFLANDTTYYKSRQSISPAPGTCGDVTLKPWILSVKTENGEEACIDIPMDGAFFKTYLAGMDSPERMCAFLNDRAANGLKVWQDYVLGLDHTDSNATIRIAAEPRPDGQTGVRIHPIMQLTPRTGTGFSVSYQLKSPGDASGTTNRGQEFDVGLPGSGGRYRLGVLIKADSAGNAADVIPAENEVGVVRVEGGASNVVVAVPFSGYDGGLTTVSNLLPATAVPVGAELFRCTDRRDYYERWTRESTSWTAQKTIGVAKIPSTRGDYSEAADRRQVANGTGLWLSQKNGNAICLFGSVPTNGVAAKIVTTVTAKTAALVANPLETAQSPTITTPAEGDTIQFPTSAGPLRTYRYAKGKWVCWENGALATDLNLPLILTGTGFWYVSTGMFDVEISWER